MRDSKYLKMNCKFFISVLSIIIAGHIEESRAIRDMMLFWVAGASLSVLLLTNSVLHLVCWEVVANLADLKRAPNIQLCSVFQTVVRKRVISFRTPKCLCIIFTSSSGTVWEKFLSNQPFTEPTVQYPWTRHDWATNRTSERTEINLTKWEEKHDLV